MANYQHKKFTDLIKSNESEIFSYADLLNTEEWYAKREIIINRDGKKCTSCGRKPTENIKGNFYRELSEEERNQRQLADQVEFDLQDDYYNDRLQKLGVNFRFKSKAGAIIALATDKPLYLHAHHKFYIFRNLPWEYDNSALITLCNECHFDIHNKQEIPMYTDEEKSERLNLTVCGRCNGSGFLHQYDHVQNGICFECWGAKYVELIGEYKEGH